MFYGVGAGPTNPNLASSISNKDPLLANLRTGDFRLQANSPARRAGVDAGLATDRQGTPRGGANGFDVGAYQFSDATTAKLACAQQAIFTPGRIRCTVGLDSEAAQGGVEVLLASGNPNLVPPSRVVIPEGATSIDVDVQAVAVPVRIQTNLSASLSDAVSNASLWLLPAGDTAPLMLRVANAASFLSDGVSPGELVTLFGLNFGPRTGAGPLVDGSRIGTSVAGTRVLFDGAPAALVYVEAGQLTATVPFSDLSTGRSARPAGTSHNRKPLSSLPTASSRASGLNPSASIPFS